MSEKEEHNPNMKMVYDLVTVNTARVLNLTGDVADLKAKIDMLKVMVSSVVLLVVGVLVKAFFV